MPQVFKGVGKVAVDPRFERVTHGVEPLAEAGFNHVFDDETMKSLVVSFCVLHWSVCYRMLTCISATSPSMSRTIETSKPPHHPRPSTTYIGMWSGDAAMALMSSAFVMSVCIRLG
jgi:hypothetical protein